MVHRVACYSFVLFLFILLVGVPGTAMAGITGIHYRFIYDPLDDYGLLNVEVPLYLSGCDFLEVLVAVIGEGSRYALLNYTSSGDVIVGGLNYLEDNGYMELFACGKGTISAVFGATDIFEEDGVLSYSTVLDTSQLADMGVPVAVEVIIVGNYALFVEGIGIEVHVDQAKSTIRAYGHGLAFITLQGSLEEMPAPPPAESPTATPMETPVNTTTVMPPTPPPHTTEPQVTATPVQQEAPLPGLMLAIILAVVTAVIGFLLATRRR